MGSTANPPARASITLLGRAGCSGYGGCPQSAHCAVVKARGLGCWSLQAPSAGAGGTPPFQASPLLRPPPVPHIPQEVASAVAGSIPAGHRRFGLPLSFLASSQG